METRGVLRLPIDCSVKIIVFYFGISVLHKKKNKTLNICISDYYKPKN